jgi:hypothetical protein
VITDDQLKALGYTRPEHGIFRQTPVYYLSRGFSAAGNPMDFPPNITPPLESVAYNVKDYVPVSLPDPSRTDGRILWDAVIHSPFDDAPRGQLADYLQENGLFPNAVETVSKNSVLHYRYQPFWTRLCGWEGPGVLGCFDDGLVDAWLGSMAQFAQACRSGLFTEFPITNVLIWDRQPMPTDRYGREDYNIVRWFDSATYQPANDRNEMFRCIIPDIFVIFMREYHSAPAQGYKDEDNPRYVAYMHPEWATLALSQAMVNVGRHTAGLPILKFPALNTAGTVYHGEPIDATGSENLWYQKWQEWRTVYRNGVKVADGEFAASVLSRYKLP